MEFESPPLDPILPEQQYILTQVGDRRMAFPTDFVVGILLVERSHILPLPFYQDGLLGIVHHQGQLVTLVALQQLLEGKPSQSREVFNAVQLGDQAGVPDLALVIERLLGNCGQSQVSADNTIDVFQPQLLDSTLWQPQRWVSVTR